MQSLRPFQWFVYQQDYLWFLVVFGCAALFFAWKRLARADGALAWLPWAAATGILSAIVELSQLITPVQLVPFAAPWLKWDMALGGAIVPLAGGLWWTVARQRGWSGWKVAPLLLATMGLAAGRYYHPFLGSTVLCLLIFGAAAVLVRSTVTDSLARSALLAGACAVLTGTNGPLAEGLGLPHRYTELSPYGLSGALAFLAMVVAGVFALYRRTGFAAGATVTRADLILLARIQAFWLLLGIALATIMGAWTRSRFEENLLSRVRMAAELVNKPYLESHLGPEFRVDRVFMEQFQEKFLLEFNSRYLASNDLKPLAEELTTIERANTDIDWSMVVTLRDGQLVMFGYSSQQPPSLIPGDRGRYGPPDAATWQSWCERRAEILGPVEFYYGYAVQARAPLLSAQGRMLGWLTMDLGVAHWLAAQVQARLLAFVVILLGGALLAANWYQRIRDRVRAAARREADAALAANRLKAAFLAKVSHELRTPIQSLLGYSELLRQRVTDDPKATSWLASLQQHGELMTRLVNDLVDLGALESGGFQLVPRTIEPAALVSQAIESFRPRAESRGLTLACFIDHGLPEWVSLDGERFRQVLINLVGNALKYTERGGVTVALRPEPDHLLVLTVRDTGPGIAPAEQEKLFVAFSRLELTANKEGTGLGLALSAGICKSMGGSLRVTSDGIAGSCFTATFRAAPAPIPVVSKPAHASPSLRGRRILVVDDNPLVRELFIAFLTEQGAMCAAAGTGAEALAQGDASEFDAIILDLALPDGDGTEFVGRIRERARDARLIGVSAHASAADRQRALVSGMDAFLTKPVALGALAAAITAAPDTGDPAFGTEGVLRERLARQFIQELTVQRATLEAAIRQRDWSRVQALAHYLKNSAVVIRDDALFDVCTGLEQAAQSGAESGVQHWWMRCQPHFDQWGPAAV